jgi:hypothetical protein
MEKCGIILPVLKMIIEYSSKESGIFTQKLKLNHTEKKGSHKSKQVSQHLTKTGVLSCRRAN